MTKDLPSPELLRKLLRYEPKTGKLFWLYRDDARHQWNARYAGAEAFTAKKSNGYKHGKIYGDIYQAHRVIWAIVHGEWPDGDIDHINGDKTNNTIANLRKVSRSENLRNAKMKSNNTSGHNGVSWDTRKSKWVAMIGFDGKQKHLGYFANIANAIAARKVAETGKGFTERHGQ